jgi:outer membrane protein assembly factor BamB
MLEPPISPCPFVTAMLLAIALCACNVPPDVTPHLDPTYLPAKGITVFALDTRSLVAIRTKDGAALWNYRPPKASADSFVARPLGYLTCAPALAKNGTLVIGYSDRIVVIDSDTGLERWTHLYALFREGAQCPAVSADSGVIFVDPHEARVRNILKKLDLNGALQWKTILPDVGLLQGAPQVDDQTGDIVVQAPTHIVGLSPEGLVNWVRERSALTPL